MRKGVLRARGYGFLSPPHGAKASRGHGVLTAHACAARHTCKQNERGEERRSPVFQGQRGQALGLLSDPLTRTRIIERRKKVASRRRGWDPDTSQLPNSPQLTPASAARRGLRFREPWPAKPRLSAKSHRSEETKNEKGPGAILRVANVAGASHKRPYSHSLGGGSWSGPTP